MLDQLKARHNCEEWKAGKQYNAFMNHKNMKSLVYVFSHIVLALHKTYFSCNSSSRGMFLSALDI